VQINYAKFRFQIFGAGKHICNTVYIFAGPLANSYFCLVDSEHEPIQSANFTNFGQYFPRRAIAEGGRRGEKIGGGG
jgi:hypothetical protein